MLKGVGLARPLRRLPIQLARKRHLKICRAVDILAHLSCHGQLEIDHTAFVSPLGISVFWILLARDYG